jgi:hypothetical protein
MTTNTSMSVFNKYTDENKNVIFKKHLIDNVFWDDSKGINRNLGYENADDVNVFIPKDQNDMSGYVKPKKYKGLNNTWTLENGDFIIKGNVEESSVTSIKELLKKYDDVFTISLADDKDFGSTNMQHFEIRGK